MDAAVREILINILKNVILTTDNTYKAYEMAWRTYAVLVEKDSDFYQQYENQTRVSFEQMHHSHAAQQQQLRAGIELLESIR